MSYADALADLKADFGKKKLLTSADIAPYIGRTASAIASLRSRKGFPPAKKEGGKVVVSIYALAHYIGDDESADDTPIQPKRKTKQQKLPKANANATDKSKPTRRPPSLGKMLKVMRARREQMELQLEFQRDLYIELEAIELDRTMKKGKPGDGLPPL